MSLPELFRFPNPVNEVSARLVAAGVVLMSVGVLLGAHWLLVPLALAGTPAASERPSSGGPGAHVVAEAGKLWRPLLG